MRSEGELVLQESWLVEQSSVLRWFRHGEKIEDDRLIKIIIGSDARGVRLRGSRQMGWMDGAKSV